MMYYIRNIKKEKSIYFRGFKLFPYVIAHKICILKVIQKAIYVFFVALQIQLQTAILISGNTACKRQYNQDQSYKIEDKKLDFIITAIISTSREDISWHSSSQKTKKYNQNY